MFDDLLKTIFNETVNKSSNSNTKNESKSDNESDNEGDNESDNKRVEYYYEMRQLNNWFKTIDQTKSLEDQIELLKGKGQFSSEYWNVRYYHDNKELDYKIFKTKAAYLLHDLDEQLFEKIFGHIFTALVDKLINTVDKKEENQIIINDIKNNSNKIIEQEHSQFII